MVIILNSSYTLQGIFRRMESPQNRSDLPLLKKLPFAETVEQLHRYNVHVAQVCFNSTQSMINSYNANKQRYCKETMVKNQERAKVMDEMEQTKRKSLQAKQKEIKRRNQENLSKIQHYLNDRRHKITRKEKQLMEESTIRREQYLKTLTSSFHHSQDRRSKIKQRQENELQRSLLLLEQNQEKMRIANERKAELLEEIKTAIKQKNQEVSANAIESCREKQASRKDQQLQRLIQKYDAAGKHISGLDSFLEKRTLQKRKEDEKLLEKHRKKRMNHLEEKQRKIEEDVQKDTEKITKANQVKQHYLETSIVSLETKRKQKQKQLLYNTFYIQEETDKKANAILHRHHTSQINLLNAKVEKERLRDTNLQDSFRATLRT